MTTKEAFEHLTSKRKWYENLDIERRQAAGYKTRAKQGKVAEKTMKKLLRKAGYTVPPEVWTAPE